MDFSTLIAMRVGHFFNFCMNSDLKLKDKLANMRFNVSIARRTGKNMQIV